MYLVSLYFDNNSTEKIQGLINKAAGKSGNNYMIDGNVPPHITIASFQADNEDKIIEVLENNMKNIKSGAITWASIGVFKSSVLFLAPVLNEYLHNLCVSINSSISSLENILVSKYYLPFQWLPHTTIAKKLSEEELFLAFQELENKFSLFSGTVTKIALSKTNPYEDIIVWELGNCKIN